MPKGKLHMFNTQVFWHENKVSQFVYLRKRRGEIQVLFPLLDGIGKKYNRALDFMKEVAMSYNQRCPLV